MTHGFEFVLFLVMGVCCGVYGLARWARRRVERREIRGGVSTVYALSTAALMTACGAYLLLSNSSSYRAEVDSDQLGTALVLLGMTLGAAGAMREVEMLRESWRRMRQARQGTGAPASRP